MCYSEKILSNQNLVINPSNSNNINKNTARTADPLIDKDVVIILQEQDNNDQTHHSHHSHHEEEATGGGM